MRNTFFSSICNYSQRSNCKTYINKTLTKLIIKTILNNKCDDFGCPYLMTMLKIFVMVVVKVDPIVPRMRILSVMKTSINVGWCVVRWHAWQPIASEKFNSMWQNLPCSCMQHEKHWYMNFVTQAKTPMIPYHKAFCTLSSRMAIKCNISGNTSNNMASILE